MSNMIACDVSASSLGRPYDTIPVWLNGDAVLWVEPVRNSNTTKVFLPGHECTVCMPIEELLEKLRKGRK